MKVIAVGDLHGMSNYLKRLLANIDEDYHLVFLGDYVDRGPDSKEVLDILLKLPEERATLIMGNHDKMMIDCCIRDMYRDWGYGYGRITLKSFDFDIDRMIKYAGVMEERFVMSRIIDGCFFSHSGGNSALSIDEQREYDLLWHRPISEFVDYDYPGLRAFHGHTPVYDPTILKGRVNLDTGAAMGGYLTAAIIDTDTTIIESMLQINEKEIKTY